MVFLGFSIFHGEFSSDFQLQEMLPSYVEIPAGDLPGFGLLDRAPPPMRCSAGHGSPFWSHQLLVGLESNFSAHQQFFMLQMARLAAQIRLLMAIDISIFDASDA